jgi:thiol:disulfide interchange protein DsbD
LPRVAVLLLVAARVAFADVTFRTASGRPCDAGGFVVVVAADFPVKNGEHMSAEEGKGRGSAPRITWTNAETLDVVWPPYVDIMGFDGLPSGYMGYLKNFSVFYKLRILNKEVPVTYDVSYVVCNESCIPRQESGVLVLNEALSDSEAENINWNHPEPMSESSSLLWMLIFGLLGGLALNCMPCVFPVIMMKIFTLIKISDKSKQSARIHGLSSLLGTVSVFVSFGAILGALRPTDSGLGWGFHMQNPLVVYALLLIFLACSLHFWGIMKINLRGLPRMKTRIQNGYIASFLSGMFGGLASSACVGPFAGVAIASALFSGNAVRALSIFLAIGIGAGLPFLGVAIFPQIVNRMPKPGKWLSTFEEFMGFAMLLSCAWPIWILLSQISQIRFVLVVMCCIGVAMFAWILRKFGRSKRLAYVALVGICASALTGGYYVASTPHRKHAEICWIDYSDKILDDAKVWRSSIFLDFTASWCLNCQFNETVFEDEEIALEFQKRNIKAVKCDWTNKDERITKLMKEYGAIAVPLYIYYPGDGKDFITLPSALTKQSLLDAFAKGDAR